MTYNLNYTLFRWFHKLREAGRLYEIRESVDLSDLRHEDDGRTTSGLQEEHWVVIGAYVKVVEPFVTANALLGGDKFPTAPLVIPTLDQVKPPETPETS